MTTNIQESSALEWLAAHQDQIVDFCRRLIQTPSVNSENPERLLAEVIAQEAQLLGLPFSIVGDQPERPNVIVSSSEQGATGLLLVGHLDTVPAGDASQWSYPPFDAHIANDRIYGRGAIDTKGGMAASIYAIKALLECNALQNGRAQFIGVPDEESGATGTLGIRYLARHGLLSGLGAIYAYSGDEINLGHRGLLRYHLECHGESVHSGSPAWQDRISGANAVAGMARLIAALDALQFPYSSARYFEPYKSVVSAGTMISGGTAVNIVPDYCESWLDVRLTPELDRPAFEHILNTEIARLTAPKLQFTVTCINDVPAVISDETAPLIAAVESAIYAVKGLTAKRTVAGPANEGYLLIGQGIPTICGLGPSGANAHAPDEYVELQGLVQAAQIFALTAARLDRQSA